MNGLQMLLKSLGFDPDAVIQMISELRNKAQELDTRLSVVEATQNEILQKQDEILEILKGMQK